MTETNKTKLTELARDLGHINIIYDCGSRDALDGLELMEIFRPKELHIFECNPSSFQLCKKNVSSNLSIGQAKIYLNEIAISDKIGTIDFFPINTEKTITTHANGNPGASSLLVANGKYTKEQYIQDKIAVSTTTLFDYCKTHQPPDLLWIDLQGAELLALEGAGAILDKVKIIHLEIGFREMYKGQALFAGIDSYLKRKMFSRCHLDLGRWPKWIKLYKLLGTGPWVGNAIYISKQSQY